MDPGFTRASEYSPIPSQPGPDIIQWQESIVERLDALQESSTSPDVERRLKELERKVAGIATLKPEERQGLRETINDLLTEVQSLQADSNKQAREIEDLKRAKKELEDDIEQIREHFPRLVAEIKARLAVLEEGPDLSDNTTVQDHITALYEHMEAIGRKQVSFLEASRCLKLSKSRVLQFKAAIALDTRFIIVHSESHKQKSLIRLRKYFDGNIAVQPPN